MRRKARHWAHSVCWALAASALAAGCGSDEGSPGKPQGKLLCQTTREECIALFEGTYSGAYSGAESGTWTAYVATDGTVTGTVTRSTGTAVEVTGTVDETGVVEFRSTDVGTFQGTIDFDQKVAGNWSGSAGSGTFEGVFVSREPPTEGTGGTGSGTGGTGDTAATYCDRFNAKAAECGIEVTGTCVEPTTVEDQCIADCTLALSCTEITEGGGLLDCAQSCTTGDTRDYCGEYTNKLDTCAKTDTLLILDICGVEPTTETACVWACVLDATCTEFMDEQTLYDGCTNECTTG